MINFSSIAVRIGFGFGVLLALLVVLGMTS